MRWASPPESVAAARSSDRYPTPTLSRKRSRSSISRRISRAMARSVSVSSSWSNHSIVRRADMAVSWSMPRPPSLTARLSGRRRDPWHSGQGRTDMYSSIFSRE